MNMTCVANIAQSSLPKDLSMPARTHIRRVTVVQESTKNAMQTDSTSFLLLSAIAASVNKKYTKTTEEESNRYKETNKESEEIYGSHISGAYFACGRLAS